MTFEIPIIDLTPGTIVKATDVYPAVDVTDTTEAASGTTKKYTIAQLQTFIGGGGSGGLTWQSVAGTTQAMVNNNGYMPLNTLLTTFTLPATANPGQIVAVAGYGSGGFIIAQNAGQFVKFISQVTSTGVGGSIASTNPNTAIELINVVANTTWMVRNASGNFTLV